MIEWYVLQTNRTHKQADRYKMTYSPETDKKLLLGFVNVPPGSLNLRSAILILCSLSDINKVVFIKI